MRLRIPFSDVLHDQRRWVIVVSDVETVVVDTISDVLSDPFVVDAKYPWTCRGADIGFPVRRALAAGGYCGRWIHAWQYCGEDRVEC